MSFLLLRYSVEYIQEKVVEKLHKKVEESKKRKTGSLDDFISDKVKVQILSDITANARAPLGLFDRGYARTIARPELSHLTKQDVRHRQGTGFCKLEYNSTLESVYETSWMRAVSLCRDEYRAPVSRAGEQFDSGEGSSSVPMDMERAEVLSFVQDEADDTASLTPEEESAIQQEAKDREKRQCYTFPISLNNLLSQSLFEHADIVADLFESKRDALTDMADELYAIAMKTALLVSTVVAYSTWSYCFGLSCQKLTKRIFF